MAKRPVFVANIKESNFVSTILIDFEWFPGFSISQKQKSIESLHGNFQKKHIGNILEISSKSNIELGVSLSAFNLLIETKNNRKFTVENAFQSSKVFQNGGPFLDLLDKSPKDAKRDLRLKNSGQLTHFQFFNRKWELEPKTLFYDWLYINAVSLNKELSNELLQYDAFTDIEFNPDKSINCQAKSAALFVSLHKAGLLEYVLESEDKFREVIVNKNKEDFPSKKINSFNINEKNHEQLSLFDFDK